MRDFFYNKGDVLIAILIILVAAVVIYFRVGVVMGDSDPGERLKNLFSPILTFITGERGSDEAASGEEGQGNNDSAAETPVQTEPNSGTEAPPEQAPATEEPAGGEGPPVEEPPPPGAAEVKITINAGDAASTIADKLLQAGAISDKQAFLSEVDAQGVASKLKQGTFTIPAGSSIKDIISILVG